MAAQAKRRATPSGRLLVNAATGLVLLFLVAPILVVFPL